jgi:DNA-binding NarL/FixJ family response regulator
MADTRILIADSHEVVRCGLRRVLEADAGCEVVGEAADGRDVLAKAIETNPDVAVIAYALPGLDGIEVTRQLRAELPDLEVLIFTSHDSPALVQASAMAGARGYLLKSDANEYLVKAIESLALHRPFCSPRFPVSLLRKGASGPARATAITNRQRTIIQLVAEGYSNKAIAKVLKISLKTVETHRAAAMRKLELSSPAALVRYAVRNNIVAA